MVLTIESSNCQWLFLRDFGLARALELLLIVRHTRSTRSLIRSSITDTPEDISERLEGIGDFGKASGVWPKHIEEVFTSGIEKGESATAAEVDIVGERGEKLLAGA